MRLKRVLSRGTRVVRADAIGGHSDSLAMRANHYIAGLPDARRELQPIATPFLTAASVAGTLCSRLTSGTGVTVCDVNWFEGRLAAYDIETTGTDTESDRIVTAAVSIVGGGEESESHTWLVNPEVEIPAEATSVHGITTEKAKTEGQDAATAVAEITSVLASAVAEDIPIVAFNARFDLTILDREARRHGVEPLIELVGGSEGLLVIDPYVLDKQINKFRKGSRTLSILCEDYGIPLTEAHAADADALAAARLAWKLGRINAELGAYDLPTLHDDQILWADEQGRSLQEYFDRQGRVEKVQTSWPLVPYAA